ncbi:MAG: hypothetical protein ACOX3Q_06815 [Clostridia bacterium]|jgi:hypothetical protein|nr:hypothetical protein [Clostridiaceae bacterium]
MFGVSSNSTANYYTDPVTGDYVPYYAYTPYKDYLRFFSEMEEKGYIRKLPQGLALLDVISLGMNGYNNIWDPDRVLGNDGSNFPPGSILLKSDPDATFVITVPQGEYGKFQPNANMAWRFYEYVVGNIPDAKLIRLLMLLEYSHFGENWLRYKAGIENVHYKWVGEPFKSPLVYNDPATIPKKYAGLGSAGFGQFGNQNFIGDTIAFRNWTPFIVQWIAWWEDHGGYYNEDIWIRPDKLFDASTMTPEQYQAFDALNKEFDPQITVVRNEFIDRMNKGQIANWDAEWEQYIEQLYAAGLEKLVEFMNKDEVKEFKYYASLN